MDAGGPVGIPIRPACPRQVVEGVIVAYQTAGRPIPPRNQRVAQGAGNPAQAQQARLTVASLTPDHTRPEDGGVGLSHGSAVSFLSMAYSPLACMAVQMAVRTASRQVTHSGR